MAIDPVIYMQVEMSNLYMSRFSLTLDEFIALDEANGLLEFIEEGYGPFHLMGDQGILDEIHDYVQSARDAD